MLKTFANWHGLSPRVPLFPVGAISRNKLQPLDLAQFAGSLDKSTGLLSQLRNIGEINQSKPAKKIVLFVRLFCHQIKLLLDNKVDSCLEPRFIKRIKVVNVWVLSQFSKLTLALFF